MSHDCPPPLSCRTQVREQRDEHPTVQCSGASLLAAQLHGRVHMVTTICRGERYMYLHLYLRDTCLLRSPYKQATLYNGG